jgi:hypothetical protein
LLRPFDGGIASDIKAMLDRPSVLPEVFLERLPVDENKGYLLALSFLDESGRSEAIDGIDPPRR